MSNPTDCPNCDKEIDATQAAIEGECSECGASFVELVDIASGDDADPEDAGPFYEEEL